MKKTLLFTFSIPLLLALLFTICQLLGFRQLMACLSGTSYPHPEAILGMLSYITSYLGVVIFAPIFILTGCFYFLFTRVLKTGE